MAIAEAVLGGLRLAVFQYQYPDAQDYWDGNWLIAELAYADENSSRVKGALLASYELVDLLKQMQLLYVGEQQEMKFEFMECWEIELAKAEAKGIVKFRLPYSDITDWKASEFRFEVNDEQLSQAIEGLKNISVQFPVRNLPKGE